MTDRIAIVSAGNDGYFHLLDGLLASLEDARLPDDFGFCVYDVGLTSRQISLLASRKVTVVAPGWDSMFPLEGESPPWFRAMTNRPCMPRYFPGFETYVWIDADAWVQQPEGIFAAVAAARKGGVAIVAERYGKDIIVPGWNSSRGFEMRTLNESFMRENLAICYKDCFGPEYEHRAQQTCYNTGFFAMQASSPIWDQWLHYIRRGISRAWHKQLEQQALTLGILEGKFPATVIGNRYNWNMACLLPQYDPRNRQLVDPEDGKPLGLVHLTELKHLHFVEIPDVDHQMVDVRLRYRDWRAHRRLLNA